jgi:MFS transporter, SP family, arabinose:H+ symporter
MSGSTVLMRSTIAVSLGGLLSGFTIALIVFTGPAIAALYPMPFSWTVFAVPLALFGAAIGAIPAGVFMSRIGHHYSLRGLAVLFFVSFFGGALAWDWYILLVFLFIAGIAIGASSVLCPVYIAEIAPTRIRGALTVSYQLNFVAGLLIGYFINQLVTILMAVTGFDDFAWRVNVGIASLPAVLFLLALFFISKSPRRLVHGGRSREARKVLQVMGERDADCQLQRIIETFDQAQGQVNESVFGYHYRRPIFLAVSIALLTQLSGIYALVYHWKDFSGQVVSGGIPGDIQVVVFGFVGLISTIIAMPIIDLLGRRSMLLIGSAGSFFCLAGIAFVFHAGISEVLVFPLFVCATAFFAFSQGAVLWVYSSEVFPNRVRAKGQGLACFACWIMGAAVIALLHLAGGVGMSTIFSFFASMTALQFAVALLAYPESKGLSLEELQRKLSPDTMTGINE